MLTFVNEELFSYATKHEVNAQTKKEILQLSVSTSNYLVTYAKGSKMDKYHNPQQDQKINKNHLKFFYKEDLKRFKILNFIFETVQLLEYENYYRN